MLAGETLSADSGLGVAAGLHHLQAIDNILSDSGECEKRVRTRRRKKPFRTCVLKLLPSP